MKTLVGERHLTRIITEDVSIQDRRAGEEGSFLPRITATLTRGDTVNRNGRRYPTDTLRGMLPAANTAAAEGRLIGLMNHPAWTEGAKGTPERTVIRWTAVELNGDDLIGHGEVLETALGRDLLALKRGGVRIGLSTNAYVRSHYEGDLEHPEDWIEVIDEIELLTVDVVNDPSNEYAAVHAEAVARREAAWKENSVKDNPDQRPTVTPEALTAERDAALAKARQAEDALEALKAEKATVEAEAVKARRAAIAAEALAALPNAAQAIRDAVLLTAINAASDDDARKAATALTEALASTTTGGNGNNGIPTPTKTPAGDPLREARAAFAR